MMRRRGEPKKVAKKKRLLLVIIIAVAMFELGRLVSLYFEMTTHEATPRAFGKYKFDLSLACLKPETRWFGKSAQSSPIKRGLFFAKLFNTGSTTAIGVHLRIAKNLARRLHPGDETEWPICKTRFDTRLARAMKYGSRTRSRSFLWSVVREPNARASSLFFHIFVAMQDADPRDQSTFLNMLLHDSTTQDYYLKSLDVRSYVPGKSDPDDTINSILSDYDFIAITERMDESAVALMMILDIPMADVLFLSADESGKFDDGADVGGGRECHFIPEIRVTEEMRLSLDSQEWKDRVKNDQLFYETANASLDMTIEKLGREQFEENLAKFRQAQTLVKEQCLPKAVFPCTKNGQYIPVSERNCLWNGSGCANDCVDEIATML